MSPLGKTTGPLVVVSNRLPYNLPRDSGTKTLKRNVGGLVNALEPVISSRGGTWVGWDGIQLSTSGMVASALARPASFRAPSGINLHGVPLSSREVERYYHGFSNRAIWPLFHDFPGKAVFVYEDFNAYVRVNQRFADSALARVGKEGRIWVQDFHLMLVPLFLREKGFLGRIDFFLHIPFPAPEIFRALPWREEILKGLLSANSVAFHVELYRDNFVSAACSLVRARQGVPDAHERIPLRHAKGRTVAMAAPIGIDVKGFESVSNLQSVVDHAARLKRAHKDCKIIFGADRLDYTKGIKERLLALEHHLIRNPASIGKIVLIQLVVPSRYQVEEYKTLKREIDREVGRINGMFGREGWVPIHYLYRALDREDLVAHYKAADIALVTPLRDGMNLVAPEFAACRVDNDGILIISEFAGIAERCDGAILVNPYDLHGMARALTDALQMPADERKRRMRNLRRFVRTNEVSHWASQCLGQAKGHEAGQATRRSNPSREAADSKEISAGR